MVISGTERGPVEVSLGKPFQISPKLGQIQAVYPEGEVILDTIPLNVQGGGIGEIQVMHNPGTFLGDCTLPIRVPTGEIRATSIYSDEGIRISIDDSPVELLIDIGRMPQKVLQSLRFEVVYGDRTFRARMFIDGMEDPDTGNTIKAASAYSYIDLRDQSECFLVLPQDPEVFRNLYMTLSSDPNTHLRNTR